MEKEIIKIIEENGPLTGAEILEISGIDSLMLWRTCNISKDLSIRIAGRRYLRLDRRIEGFARLSPSILREFLTYSVVGLTCDLDSLEERANKIVNHIECISREKSELAHSIASVMVDKLENELLINERVCFIIAGDIVYNMAHDVPRPERSTGRLVKGSDMDIVVIVDDLFPKKQMERLDEVIYQEKYRFLMTPHIREEIDYIVKDLNRVREQVRFDTFKHMVACKILQEGTLLYGSEKVFHTVKKMLRDHGVNEKLMEMEERARAFREKGEKALLMDSFPDSKEKNLNIFYPTEESEEFE